VRTCGPEAPLLDCCCLLQDKYFSDLGVAVDQQGLQQQQHKDSSVQLLSDLPAVRVLEHIMCTGLLKCEALCMSCGSLR
jgi:hypothetical protein